MIPAPENPRFSRNMLQRIDLFFLLMIDGLATLCARALQKLTLA
jgi:hypothetical protein